MKQIYRLAQAAFVDLGLKQPPGKAYQMGFVDGYLEGFREARKMAAERVDTRTNWEPDDLCNMGEEEESPRCGAV